MALPDYSPGGGFYDPTRTYTGYLQPQFPVQNIRSGGAFNEGFYRNYATDNPQAEYNRRLTEMGYGGTGSRARAAQQLFGQVQSGYEQAKIGSNVNLFFPEYLDQTELEKTIQQQSLEAQGLDPRRFGQKKYRWGLRGT